MGYKSCEKSSTCKPVNAVTKSVPNSGRSSPTNTESTQPEPTMATPTFSSNESTSTTTKPFAISHHEASKCPPLSLVTPPPSKNSSNESPNNSPLCSDERLSCTGTLVKVWTRWNSLKPRAT